MNKDQTDRVSIILRASLSSDETDLVLARVLYHADRQDSPAIARIISIYVPSSNAATHIADRIILAWNATAYNRYSRIAAWQYLLESGVPRDNISAFMQGINL